MSKPPDAFMRQAETLGIVFEEGDLARLGQYLALLLDANTRFNLTAITDPDESWIKHIFDSLTLLPWIASVGTGPGGRVIDVGSGGGLPGLPLAIVMPDMRFTLLEATGKKATFLRETATQLGLANVEVVNDRAETTGHDHTLHREQYDIAVARAVGKLAVLLELTTPLVKVGGHVFAIKGEKAREEVEEAKGALHRLHCHAVDLQRTPTGTVIVIEKQRATPRIYPRRPGEPKRAPLM